MQFTGKITEVSKVKTGEGQKGEWASVDVEVTELNPKNPTYPQIAGFSYFKNGEYAKYAKSFATDFPVGTIVDVEFNFKRSPKKYAGKDGVERYFYKTEAWKITKAETSESLTPAEVEQINAKHEAPVVDTINVSDTPF